jgi:hypothetical protein
VLPPASAIRLLLAEPNPIPNPDVAVLNAHLKRAKVMHCPITFVSGDSANANSPEFVCEKWTRAPLRLDLSRASALAREIEQTSIRMRVVVSQLPP